MYVLGIGTHVSCGSALLKDGIVVAAVNDERLVREKMVFGMPRKSILEVMNLAGVTARDIDYVAVSTKRQHFINGYVDYRGGKFGHRRGVEKQVFFRAGSLLSRFMGKLPWLEQLYFLCRQPFFVYRRFKIRQILRREFKLACPVEFLDHHFCHAASAYYSGGFDDAMVITIDSAGDGVSSQVYRVEAGKFQKLWDVPSYHSPAQFYSYATQLCGFEAGKHEGKVTGLAAHGAPSYIDVFRRLIAYDNGTFKNIGNVFFFSALERLRSLLPEGFKREDLASSIQIYTEEMITGYVRYWLEKTKQANVALAGGLFANVRINQKIYEVPGVSSVFIHPGMSDEGQAVGAALALYYEKAKGGVRRCLNHVYLGPAFSDEEIKSTLDAEEVKYRFHEDIESEVARRLAEGYVVARFNGRMEYGPRALGNRSILYQAADPSVNDWLNKSLRRTEFMPFAPITLMEDAEKCYVNVSGAKDAARFMTITFDCTDWMKDRSPGVVHVDGTARPQLLAKNDNPSLYKIVEEYRRITGLESIINTSFNMHEEPIVCNPSDAVRAFKLGHLDYLAIGNYLVTNGRVVHVLVKPAAKKDQGKDGGAVPLHL